MARGGRAGAALRRLVGGLLHLGPQTRARRATARNVPGDPPHHGHDHSGRQIRVLSHQALLDVGALQGSAPVATGYGHRTRAATPIRSCSSSSAWLRARSARHSSSARSRAS